MKHIYIFKVFMNESKLTKRQAYMTEKYGFAEKKAFHSEILTDNKV